MPGEQEQAATGQHAAELGQRGAHVGVVDHVDQRVEADQAVP
ncbi:MAG TPA: hypothetical protein VHS30_29640 [Streptosporangiaceae bacterium]|nr:hypothetical protein [Streptosporangiaceae bacterium]